MREMQQVSPGGGGYPAPPPGFPQGTIILRDFWVSGPSQEQINQLSENTIRAQLECLKNKRW
jgi:hypothetical protein